MEFLYGLLAVLGLIIIIVLIRALTFKPEKLKAKDNRDINTDGVVEALGQLLKIKTVSYEDQSKIDFVEFQKYIDKTKELFPLAFKKCEFTQTKEYAMIFKLKGKSSAKPTVLMAHYDVVPVTDGWDYDPFLGEVVDGYLYGRGSLDTKNTMACAMYALEKALENNYQPKNDLYLCFGSNEEIFGDAQVKIVEEFKKKNIKPALVFDEGGGILTSAFPGVKNDVAFLGLVEKGMMNVKLEIDTNGGHSSTPKRNGPAIRLSKALVKLEKHQMKTKYTKTLRAMLDIMGRNSTFALKLVLGNMWLFKGLLKKVLPMLSADINALLRTTFAFTILNGGNQTNVIPNHVEANINVRVAPFNTPDEVLAYIKKIIKDDSIKLTAYNINKMYNECDYESEGYAIIKDTINDTFENVVVSPFIMLGGTDGRHYNEISDCVIRFSPMRISNEDRHGIHGLNEKIKVEYLEECAEFYIRLLEKI